MALSLLAYFLSPESPGATKPVPAQALLRRLVWRVSASFLSPDTTELGNLREHTAIANSHWVSFATGLHYLLNGFDPIRATPLIWVARPPPLIRLLVGEQALTQEDIIMPFHRETRDRPSSSFANAVGVQSYPPKPAFVDSYLPLRDPRKTRAERTHLLPLGGVKSERPPGN